MREGKLSHMAGEPAPRGACVRDFGLPKQGSVWKFLPHRCLVTKYGPRPASSVSRQIPGISFSMQTKAQALLGQCMGSKECARRGIALGQEQCDLSIGPRCVDQRWTHFEKAKPK